MALKPHEQRLAGVMLRLASEQFSSFCCNDFDLVSEAGLTKEEAFEINKSMAEQSGDTEEWEDDDLNVSHAVYGNAGVMSYLAKRLKDGGDR